MAKQIGINIKSVKLDEQKATQQIQSQLNKIGRGLTIQIGGSSRNLNQQFNNLNNTMNTTRNNLGNINSRIQENINNTRRLGQESNTVFRSYNQNLTSIIKKFGLWLGVGNLYFQSFRQLREGLVTLKEIDDIMTQIARVTGMSAEQLDRLAIKATLVGQELSKTAQEFLSSMAAFSKMGFVEDQAEQLSKYALMLSSVGDISIEQSQKTLISTTKAMGLEMYETSKIMDSLNDVSNKNATSVDELSKGLMNFASTAKTANLNLDETIGLLGGLQATSQKSGAEVKIKTTIKNSCLLAQQCA